MLKTKRTFIRPIEPADAVQIFSYRSDAGANKYQGWIPKSLEEVDAFIAKNQADFNTPDTWFQLVIIEKESQKIIGDIGVHFLHDGSQSEIGCTINKVFQNKGFATEALSAIIEYLFTTLKKHRIVASIDPKNTNSISLVKRLGFRKEAHHIQSLFINGEWVDDVIYAILNDEWQ
ncbi:MAG: GNAT family N-acetyltransferase [Marinilabiliales bacterium]|nr:MAG: GNAT family N-acetyltransferase [Marinilabiliales bacterium]